MILRPLFWLLRLFGDYRHAFRDALVNEGAWPL